MKYILSCVFIFLFYSSGFSSVYLYNNSPFILKAQVVAANGVDVGEEILQPGATKYLEDQIGTSNPVGKGNQQSFQNYKQSLTPYQVFWYCAKGDGSLYATCTSIAAGATVMATTCSGPCHCKPPKQEKKPPEEGADKPLD